MRGPTVDRRWRGGVWSASMVQDPIVAGGIAVLAIVVALLFVAAVARSAGQVRRARHALLAIAGVLAWYASTGALAAAGVLGRFELRPPPMVLFMVSVLALGIGLGLSPLGGRIARTVPLSALVGAQAFRLPLELVMHRAAREGIMPVQLSFSGFNFDILVGSLAIPVAALLAAGRCPRWLPWLWNLLGFGTLTMIAVIAVATTPLVAAFGPEPRNLNLWVTHFPYVWLPAGLVAFALAGHVVVARRLRAGAVAPERV